MMNLFFFIIVSHFITFIIDSSHILMTELAIKLIMKYKKILTTLVIILYQLIDKGIKKILAMNANHDNTLII